MSEKPSDRALQPRDVPPLKLARSLDEAPPRSFLYVDSRGRVRSPALYKFYRATSYAFAGITVGALAVTYSLWFGAPGALVALPFLLVLAWSFTTVKRLNRAAVLTAHDRLDEAEEVFTSVAQGRLVPRRFRALSKRNLAAVAMRRGDHETALTHLRAARKIYDRLWFDRLHPRLCRTTEVIVLCNLGRVHEARALLGSLGPPPAGEFLRITHWTAELYVMFTAGEVTLDDSELSDRSRRALKITVAADLLALCAWASHAKGDTDMAWHLLREAWDRAAALPLERTVPPLHAWMVAHHEEALRAGD